MLVIDGVKYKLWIPKDEEKDFHPLIKEHSKEIFGENSLYLPVEKRLVSKAGRGVMPDGFAIIFSEKPEIYVVEVELSKHDLDKHIVEQLNRFGRAIKNPRNQKAIADRLHKEIKSNLITEAFVKQMIGQKEIYKFLSDLASQTPQVVIIIEEKNAKVIEACEGLKISPEIREFKTFVREDAPNVRAHLFEPISAPITITPEGKKRGMHQWSEDEFFRALNRDLPSAVSIVRNLYEWSKDKADRIWWGTGAKIGSFTFHYLKEGPSVSVFTVKTNGKIILNYGWLSEAIGQETMEEFHSRIHEIPTFKKVPSVFSNKWPTLKVMIALKNPENLEMFKQAVNWLGTSLKS